MKSILMAAIAIILSATSFAQAGPGHQRTHIANHPRVNKVNKRVDNQEKRITEERKEGDITKAQAKQDRKNLSSINQEKRDMRKMDKGHLTKADQKALNQQLNTNSKKIGQ
jgi:predicted transglutaminase-like cysteine proteinase